MNLDKETLAEYLNRLPMVRWDRLTEHSFVADDNAEHRSVVVFGWIDRDDDHSDFVRVEFTTWADKPGVGTSSAEWSAKLAPMILGEEPTHAHGDCQRVEDWFGGLVERKVARS